MKYRYLVIEGNIGAGKTSLVRKIAERHKARVLLERFAENPFLPKFYKDQQRYAFPLELSFLASRYNDLKHNIRDPELFQSSVIADYHFSKSLIFARATLPDDEFRLFHQLYNMVIPRLPKPNLYVYLHVEPSRLLNNIRERGRSYEQEIDADYLKKIQDGYFTYLRSVEDFPVLLVAADELDFVKKENDYRWIEWEIFGKNYKNGITRVIANH